MSEEFTITAQTALTVVVTTIVIYLVFIVFVRITGARALSSTSSFDFACVVAFGAILGRTVLLAEPTLPKGIVALLTFLVMQGLLGAVRQSPPLYKLLNAPPILLVHNGQLLQDNMRRAHIVEDELRQAVRRTGTAHLENVRCVVLERNGGISVVSSVEPVDPWLIADVEVPVS